MLIEMFQKPLDILQFIFTFVMIVGVVISVVFLNKGLKTMEPKYFKYGQWTITSVMLLYTGFLIGRSHWVVILLILGSVLFMASPIWFSYLKDLVLVKILKRDIFTGERVTRYDSGNIKTKCYYMRGKKDCVVETTYYDNGKEKSRCGYVNDIKHGFFSSCYPNGNIKKNGLYYEGKLFGVWNTYYPCGTGKLKSTFDFK